MSKLYRERWQLGRSCYQNVNRYFPGHSTFTRVPPPLPPPPCRPLPYFFSSASSTFPLFDKIQHRFRWHKDPRVLEWRIKHSAKGGKNERKRKDETKREINREKKKEHCANNNDLFHLAVFRTPCDAKHRTSRSCFELWLCHCRRVISSRFICFEVLAVRSKVTRGRNFGRCYWMVQSSLYLPFFFFFLFFFTPGIVNTNESLHWCLAEHQLPFEWPGANLTFRWVFSQSGKFNGAGHIFFFSFSLGVWSPAGKFMLRFVWE